ncbi:TsaA-like domain-containing protein [Tribonema minus]|uniref:TsaA-like domain-containing protein n=1 Tax=Tribonema minus TaxID=303371 RepID=A0A836CCT4_9STRA|nr:TsaA-like domain-containing protein [Tribonema minus]
MLCGACAAFALQQKLRRIRRELDKAVAQRDSEHSGRLAMQRELRAVMASKLAQDDALFYAPIGTISSCFKRCVGTPRQGHLAPRTRAVLQLKRSAISPDSLDGLNKFSHVWVFFVFHLNNNQRWTRGLTGGGGTGDDAAALRKVAGTFPAKVTPPFLKRKVGLFATRSPHRPNNIGLSLCRIDRVDMAGLAIHLRGIDLVHGTPVLDIKPFVPAYDAVTPAHVAPWVESSLQHNRAVLWEPGAQEQVTALAAALHLYKDEPQEAIAAIAEALEVDIRSAFMTKKAAGQKGGGSIKGSSSSGILLFDTLAVHWATQGGDFNSVSVSRVELAEGADAEDDDVSEEALQEDA